VFTCLFFREHYPALSLLAYVSERSVGNQIAIVRNVSFGGLYENLYRPLTTKLGLLILSTFNSCTNSNRLLLLMSLKLLI